MRQELKQWVALGELWRDLEVLSLVAAVPLEEGAPEPDLERLGERGAALGVDRDAFVAAVERYVAALWARETPEEPPQALIAARREELEQALELLGPSVERAETLLRVLADTLELGDSDVEAYADPAVDLPNAQRKALRGAWRDAWLKDREDRRQLSGQGFWVSRDFEDHFDDIAYYRVYERYGFGELDELFADVGKQVGERLIDGLAVSDPFGRFSLGASTSLATAQHLWLVSRSKRLRLELHWTAATVITALFHAQSDDGSWPSPITGDDGVHVSSVEATAMAVIGSRRISRDEEHRTQAARAVEWLLTKQDGDGFWRDERGEPDVLATALALDAVARSDRAGTDAICERTRDWLLAQQLASGLWRGRLPEVLLCVTVLEALRSVPLAGVALPHELTSALRLVTRSELLSRERSADGRQLAVVAAYTGIESVLYALLSHATINRTTVKQNGQVIGFNDALVEYEDALVVLGHLQQGRHVAGHNVLRTLTTVRDGVVHRGTEPAPANTRQIVDAVARFCSEQIGLVFGIDPLDD